MSECVFVCSVYMINTARGKDYLTTHMWSPVRLNTPVLQTGTYHFTMRKDGIISKFSTPHQPLYSTLLLHYQDKSRETYWKFHIVTWLLWAQLEPSKGYACLKAKVFITVPKGHKKPPLIASSCLLPTASRFLSLIILSVLCLFIFFCSLDEMKHTNGNNSAHFQTVPPLKRTYYALFQVHTCILGFLLEHVYML